MRRVVDRVGPCRFEPDMAGDRFATLVESIIYQQLQGRAAAAISNRFQAIFGGAFPTPQRLLAASTELLKSAGISPQKEAAMRDLATKVSSSLVPLEGLDDLDDGQVVEVLTRVRGIGEWTAHMFLIFHMGRLDVLPTGDYGLRKAAQREYLLRKLPEAPRLQRMAKPWSPYRTLATWYLWNSSSPVTLGKGPKD